MANFGVLPRTLQEAIQYFSDPAACFDFAVKMRWPERIEGRLVTCKKLTGKLREKGNLKED